MQRVLPPEPQQFAVTRRVNVDVGRMPPRKPSKTKYQLASHGQSERFSPATDHVRDACMLVGPH